jgi:hypothetical protein
MADIEKFIYYDNGSKKVLKPTDRIVVGSGGLAFEGATSDDFETQITVTDPTADRTIEIPDEDGEIALLQGDSLPKALSFPVKNPSTTTALTKGQIVYISGHSGNKPEVSLARSDSASTMPAFGFVQADIAAEAEGYVVYSGLFKGMDTNAAYSEGDTLYVSSTTAGGFENTPPTGSSNLIQNIGKIVKSDAINGEILVGGAGRTNAPSNLDQGKIFIGNASNQSSSSVYTLPIADGTNGQILQTNGSGAVSFVDYTDSIIAELSIPGVDLQTDTNAFRFNAPRGITVTGLDLYLDQHTTSGDVTVTVTNTTDSLSMISLTITGTNTSASTTTVTNASVDSGDIITFAITATPANAQGLRANLHYTRT